MKLSENVEIKIDEVETTNSRASRMARYSAAAAGVAVVSSLDVDAAMIKVIVTDPDAQNTGYYELDLSTIKPDTILHLSQFVSSYSSSSSLSAWFGPQHGTVAVSSSFSSWLASFVNGSTIGGQPDWFRSGYRSLSSGSYSSSFLFGFRVNQGEGDYTNGWFNLKIDDSSFFTLNSYGYNSTLNEAAIAGQGTVAGAPVAGVPDTGPGIVGLALLGAGAAGVRLLRKLRSGK